MGALGFGAAGLGKRFRVYSLATIAIVFACGAWTGTYAPDIQANPPAPGVGLWERINTSAFMLWQRIRATRFIEATVDHVDVEHRTVRAFVRKEVAATCHTTIWSWRWARPQTSG